MIAKAKMRDDSDGLIQRCYVLTKFKKTKNRRPMTCFGNTFSVDV